MELKNAFLTGIISKILTKIIKKKTGLDMVVDLTYLKIDTDPDDIMTINVTLSAYCNKDEVKDFIFNNKEIEE